MSDFFFHTSPNGIQSQQPGDQFGIVHPQENGYDINFERFRVTNFHRVVEDTQLLAPIVAVCDGTICAQFNDAGSITIVLSPDYQPSFDISPIKYIVYKGVQIKSLVNDVNNPSQIVESGNDLDNDLAKRVRKNWLKNNDDLKNSTFALGLNRNNDFELSNQHKPFQDDDYVENLFLVQNEVELSYVTRGDVIGYAEDYFGIEIITYNDFHAPKIKSIRTFEHYIELPATAATDFDKLRKRTKSKELLSYLDPCSFFTSFKKHPLSYLDSQLSKKNFSNSTLISLLSKFKNKKQIYIWIEYFHMFGYEPRPLQLKLNSAVAQPTIWPVIILEEVTQDSIDIEITNWNNIYDNNLETQTEIYIVTAANRTQQYLFDNSKSVSKTYFNKKDQPIFEIKLKQLFDSTENHLLSTNILLKIRDDVSVKRLLEFTLPTIKDQNKLRPSSLNFQYNTLFLAQKNNFYDVEAYFKGSYTDVDFGAIFYTPTLSRKYDRPYVQSFISDNFECINANFFKTFFKYKHIFIHNTVPNNKPYATLVKNLVNETEDSFDSVNNYYDGFTAFLMTLDDLNKLYSEVKALQDPLQITLYSFALVEKEFDNDKAYSNYKLVLQYYEDDNGSPQFKERDLGIDFISNKGYDNNILYSKNFDLTTTLIEYLSNSSSGQKRKKAPPLTARIFIDDPILEAIHNQKFNVNSVNYEYFEGIDKNSFIKKIFQAISIVWPEMDQTSISAAEIITVTKKICEKEEVRYIDLTSFGLDDTTQINILALLKEDIKNHFGALKDDDNNTYYYYDQNEISNNEIDNKLIAFLNDELDKIIFYNENCNKRPRTIFNVSKAKAIGENTVTWKDEAWFDYAVLTGFLFYEGDSSFNIGYIRKGSIDPNAQNSTYLLSSKEKREVALSMLLMKELEAKKYVNIGTGPTNKFLNIFFANSKEYFFNDFYDLYNSINQSHLELINIKNQQDFNVLIDRLFYFLIHYYVPMLKLEGDFFYHLFYYPKKIENFKQGYCPVDQNNQPTSISISESIELLELLRSGIVDEEGKNRGFIKSFNIINFLNSKKYRNKLDPGPARSFLNILDELDIESKYIKAYSEPSPSAWVLRYLPVNQTLYIDYADRFDWFRVSPPPFRQILARDSLYYFDANKNEYFSIYDYFLDLTENGLPADYVSDEMTIRYSYSRIEVYLLKPQTAVRRGISDKSILEPLEEVYSNRINLVDEIELIENFEGYYVEFSSVRLSSPSPAPESILYKIENKNLAPKSNSEYQLSLYGSDTLLEIAMRFYGQNGLIKDDFNNGTNEELDNRFFSNALLFVNNPHGLYKKYNEEFNFAQGGFVINEKKTEAVRASIYLKDRINWPLPSIGDEVDSINEISNFAWANTKVVANSEVWIPPYEYMISLVNIVPDGSTMGNIPIIFDDILESLDYEELLDLLWPEGKGYFIECGIGATFGIPIGVDANFYCYIVREKDKTIRLIRRGSLQAGLDASLGIGFYASKKNKAPVRSKKIKDDLGIGVQAEANAFAMGGLLIHEEFEFDLSKPGAMSSIGLLLLSQVSSIGSLFMHAMMFLGIDPYDYLKKFRFEAYATLGASAAAQAKIAVVKQNGTEKWDGFKPYDEADYRNKPAGWRGILFRILNIQGSSGGSGSLNLKLGTFVEVIYDLDDPSKRPEIEIGFDTEAFLQGGINLPFFLRSFGGRFHFGGGFSMVLEAKTEEIETLFLSQNPDFEALVKELKVYTFDGNLDYFNGLPAYQIGIIMNVNWLDVNEPEFSSPASLFVKHRIAASLSVPITNPKDFFSRILKLKKVKQYSQNQRLKFWNDDYNLTSFSGYIGAFYETSTDKINDDDQNGQPGLISIVNSLISEIYDLSSNYSDCIKSKLSVPDPNDINNENRMEFVFNLFKFGPAVIDCFPTKEFTEIIVKRLTEIFQLFNDIIVIQVINQNSLSFDMGGRVGVGFKLRLDFSAEAGVIYYHEITPDTLFEVADLLYNWMTGKYLEVTDSI